MTTMNDERGCSLCTQPGSERYETFTARIGRKSVKRVQYDYRHTNGELFATVAPTLDDCRAKRDEWIKRNQY